MIGCGKRYTDPSSLRKHVKNHVDSNATGLPGDDKILHGCKENRRARAQRDTANSSSFEEEDFHLLENHIKGTDVVQDGFLGSIGEHKKRVNGNCFLRP